MVAVIKYNAGNTGSILNALNRLSVDCILTSDADEIRAADKVIFPGVGEASSAMHHLRENRLDTLIRSLEQPVLGICLGMQLLCSFSEENETECLDIFHQAVKRFRGELKIPHVGWNTIKNLEGKLFRGMEEDNYVYFVHSYYAASGPFTSATSFYIQPFSAALEKDNFYGVQFHPEKSGAAGETILKNFLNL